MVKNDVIRKTRARAWLQRATMPSDATEFEVEQRPAARRGRTTDERMSRIEEKNVGSPSRGGAIGDGIRIRLARADFHLEKPAI
jgi:hypothetical protein